MIVDLITLVIIGLACVIAWKLEGGSPQPKPAPPAAVQTGVDVGTVDHIKAALENARNVIRSNFEQIQEQQEDITALENDNAGLQKTVQALTEAVEYHQKREAEYHQKREARAIAKQPAGPRDGEDLLRRSYHAIRILHNFRACKLKGCEYCRLGEEIVSSISAQTIASETTVRKKATE